MTREARIACAFCDLGQQEVPRLVAVEGGPAICSPCVMRCLHVLATGDELGATDAPSFALMALGRAVAARIAPPAQAGAGAA